MGKKATKSSVPESSSNGAPEADWPNSISTREELDDALEEGSKSGVSDRTLTDILAEVLARRKNAKL